MQIRKSRTTCRTVQWHFVLLPISNLISQVLYPGLPTVRSPMEPCTGSHHCTREARALFSVCLQATICHRQMLCSSHSSWPSHLVGTSQPGDILAEPCAMPSWAVSLGHKHSLAGSRCRDQRQKGVFIALPFKFATGLGKLQFSSFTSISSVRVFKGTSPAKGHTFARI